GDRRPGRLPDGARRLPARRPRAGHGPQRRRRPFRRRGLRPRAAGRRVGRPAPHPRPGREPVVGGDGGGTRRRAPGRHRRDRPRRAAGRHQGGHADGGGGPPRAHRDAGGRDRHHGAWLRPHPDLQPARLLVRGRDRRGRTLALAGGARPDRRHGGEGRLPGDGDGAPRLRRDRAARRGDAAQRAPPRRVRRRRPGARAAAEGGRPEGDHLRPAPRDCRAPRRARGGQGRAGGGEEDRPEGAERRGADPLPLALPDPPAGGAGLARAAEGQHRHGGEHRLPAGLGAFRRAVGPRHRPDRVPRRARPAGRGRELRQRPRAGHRRRAPPRRLEPLHHRPRFRAGPAGASM
ncbi:MAG: Single-stranded-DNA-specific exonuclease RecJ, partial [uncultured Acetobacteraceae bacterium]